MIRRLLHLIESLIGRTMKRPGHPVQSKDFRHGADASLKPLNRSHLCKCVFQPGAADDGFNLAYSNDTFDWIVGGTRIVVYEKDGRHRAIVDNYVLLLARVSVAIDDDAGAHPGSRRQEQLKLPTSWMLARVAGQRRGRPLAGVLNSSINRSPAFSKKRSALKNWSAMSPLSVMDDNH